jgi:hypothetical protein
MNLKKLFVALIISIIIFSLLLKQDKAVPSIPSFMINYQTHECGVFFSGDEFTHFDPPPGWQFAGLFDNKIDYEEKCKQMGYVYVNDLQSWVSPNIFYDSRFQFVLVFSIFSGCVTIGSFLFLKKRKIKRRYRNIGKN